MRSGLGLSRSAPYNVASLKAGVPVGKFRPRHLSTEAVTRRGKEGSSEQCLNAMFPASASKSSNIRPICHRGGATPHESRITTHKKPGVGIKKRLSTKAIHTSSHLTADNANDDLRPELLPTPVVP